MPYPKKLVATSQIQPGTILARGKQGILVSTVDAEQALLLEQPQFWDIPVWQALYLLWTLLRPGQSFQV